MNEIMRRLLFLPEQASTFAHDVDNLHYFVITVTMVSSLAVGLTAIAFFWKYRRRHENQATPFVAPTALFEVLAISVPLFFFLVWFAIGFRDFVKLSSPPPEAMDVYVQGKQWMWKFAYPEGPNSIGVLHVPANRPVRLLITSRDVIHSVFIPAFRVKMDALPGRYTEIWFTATKPGRYQILCTEYCGAQHSKMWGEVVVMAPEAFDEWIKEQQRGLVSRQDVLADETGQVTPQGSLAQWGLQVAVRQGCLRCHNVDTKEPATGPSWVDLYQQQIKLTDGREIVADEAYLTESMMEPTVKVVAGYQELMPNYQGKLSGAEAAAIVEFIKSLRSDRTVQAVGGEE
ncbi:MAG: cytochrome c oxidase subunit II [Myxococcaceae bacterium]|nr:MAG: cytochrome c oxidase subunit II [Myxococcaceae bacterium]